MMKLYLIIAKTIQMFAIGKSPSGKAAVQKAGVSMEYFEWKRPPYKECITLVIISR